MTETTKDEGLWMRLRRRKVVQWGIAYAAGAWGLLQGLAYVTDTFHWPERIQQLSTIALLIGLPIAVTLAWFHGDRGHSRVTRTELGILTLLFLLGGGLFWRYQHVSETVSVAAPPAPAAVIANDKSIAVLPFVNMSADQEQEYFADGLSEELLNLLAQVPQLRVIARTSSFSFKGKEVDIAEIANKLNVTHVLEGSVRKSGDTLRITAQLIRASDSSHLWSQTFDRPVTDVFKVQDEIAAAVVNELKITLLNAAPKAKTTDPKTYALFLQAREIGRQFTEAGFDQSNSLYQRALALDPRYAAAWVGLANNYCNQAFSGLRPIDEAIKLAREATNKALALEPTSALAYSRLSWIASSYDLDMSTAAQHLQHALALEPANPDILTEAGYLARRLGRLDQAIAIGEHQVTRDPINPYGHEVMAYSYRFAGRLDDAIATLRTLLSLSPDYLAGHEGIGEVLLQKGDAKAALAEMQQEVLDGMRLAGMSMAHHALGQSAESDAALAELIDKYGSDYSVNIAYVFAFRSEPDRSFEWLSKAVEYHDLYLSAVAVHPMFANLHSDPRWLPFLRKNGMAPDQLAAIKFEIKLPN